jgi:hypothetical protein
LIKALPATVSGEETASSVFALTASTPDQAKITRQHLTFSDGCPAAEQL